MRTERPKRGQHVQWRARHLYSTDADADRAFIRDVLGFPGVDAGQGWLIFGFPPAELAVHPTRTSPNTSCI
ncbi:hypothetical protein ACFH04_42005 [Streptomyces noboritoensis]|uniref:Uncharacterized protein n=1 Tax=Streptomyces noboritoensis TaxID=67337 RepID=A0ABV6TY49_9ACTN